MGGRKLLGFSVGIEIDLFFVRGSKCFVFVSGPKTPCFSVSTEIDMVLCGDGQNWLDLSAGDRTLLDFSVGMKTIWLLCKWVEIDFIFVREPRSHVFSVRACKLTWCFCGWSKFTWTQCGGSRLTRFQCRDEIDLAIVCVVEIDLIPVWGIGIDLVFVWRSKWLVRVWIEINWVFVSGHRNRLDIRELKFTWFQWWGRTLLGFWLGIEIDSVLVSVPNLIFFVPGSKSTLFLCGGRKLPNFSEWIKINFAFVCGPKISHFRVEVDWLSVCAAGRELLGFGMRAKKHLVLVWASKWTWYLCGYAKLIWFQCGGWNLDLIPVQRINWFDCCVGGRNWLDFGLVDRNWLDFSVEIRIDLYFFAVESDLLIVSGTKWTSFFMSGHRTRFSIRVGSKLTWFQWWGRN